MSKKPYIPLYVGDWVKDTDCISLEAEGALLKLVFKMWESKTPGSVTIRFSQIAILFKKSEEIARKIVQELKENDILDIEFIGENEVKIESRRMIREFYKSLTNSENGKKGGRPKSEKQKKEKRIKSEHKANIKRNADNDIDIEYDNDIENKNEKGGVGEKTNSEKRSIASRMIGELNLISGRKHDVENKKSISRVERWLKSGVSEQEMIEVMELKWHQWRQTDFEMYMRPETLFGEKFSTYLEEVKSVKNGTIKLNQNGNKNANLTAYERQGAKIREALGSLVD